MELKGFGIPFGLAGIGVGMGTIGTGMAAAGMSGTEGLVSSGQVATGFIAPAVNIVGAGMTIRLLKGFPRGRL